MFGKNATSPSANYRGRVSTGRATAGAAAALLGSAFLVACGSEVTDGEAPVTAKVTMQTTTQDADTGAGADGADEQSPETTAVATETQTVTEAAPTGDQGSGPSDEERRVALQQDVHNQLQGQVDVGDTVVFDGVSTEICVYGDGYALNLVTAGPNTSCDFAVNVFNEASSTINASQNIRDVLPQTVVATSPTTGGTYEMRCENDARNLITCKGGEDATVYMY